MVLSDAIWNDVFWCISGA